MRVMLVEDHPTLREMMHAHLRRSGYAVDSFERGHDALAAAAHTAYAAALLDLTLPDIDGMDVLRALRSGQQSDLRVLVLTARDGIADRVAGLDAGADDYLLKPFDLAELDARLRSILRRTGTPRSSVERFGDLAYDLDSHEARIGDAPLSLSRRETLLLAELVRAGGRTVVRDALEERLYGFNEATSANALEAVVSRLRRRLQAASSSVTVEPVRGIGYRIVSAA